MGRLTDRIAVVTGAGRGIGKEIALLMASEGAKVVVNDLGGNTDGTGGGSIAQEVADEIISNGGDAVANTNSVAEIEGGKSIIDSAVEAFGGLDILVNNAGILRDRTIFNMEESDWDAVIAVHLKGHYCCTRPFAQYIREQNRTGCRIINFSSVSGLYGNFGQANYGAAKAGLAGFMRVLALEGIKYGITVNVLAPAALSRMTEDLMPESEETAVRMAPEKVSPTVAWLCTDAAAKVTGRQFCVSGNRTTLLSWQYDVLAERDSSDEPWTVEAIGEQIEASMDSWPKLLKPMEV